jgi:carboxyl-terminal processing protease
MIGSRVIARRLMIGTAGVSLLGGAFAIGMHVGGERVRSRDVWADGRLLSNAIDSVRANALDSLPSDELIKRAVSGMLRELQDPYAALLRPDGYRNYRGTLLGESQGLGMTLRWQGSNLSVRRVAAGSPAASAGVRRGDRVLTWNGVAANDPRLRSGADSGQVQGDHTDLLLLRSPVGDSVRVTVHRNTWHTPAITESGMLDETVGYVRLSSISQSASRELQETVEYLTRRGARSLVLDLRGNGGGLFEEGVKAAGLFLPSNALVASLTGRGGTEAQQHRVHNSRWPTMPLTLLVDAGTASSAEVIAAALREHGRAVLVGAPTYGKGVVQRIVRLSPDLSLRLTTARWLTPTGRTLQRREGAGRTFSGGLRPDVMLADAAWRDPSSTPRNWNGDVVRYLLSAVDSVSAQALREEWAVTPVSELEERLRQRVTARAPRRAPSEWATVAARLATVRLLELHGRPEELLRYSLSVDAPLRTGLTLLAPPLAADLSQR